MTGKKQIFEWITITLREAAWAPLAVFGFYLFGLVIGLYKAYPPVDIPTHFMGGVTITYFYRAAIRNLKLFFGELPLLVRIVFAFTCTGTTIILWEFYENTFDYLFGTHMVRGLEDTIMDMFIGLMGALVLSLFYRRG